MKYWAWAVLGVLLAGAGLTVYGYGAGYFWPCEVLGDRKLCNEVASLEGRSFNGLAVRPDGMILTTTRQHGTEPTEPIELVTLDPADGIVLSSIEIGGLAPNVSVADMAISADGDRIALAGQSFFQVVDAQGAFVAGIDRGLPAYMGFDAEGRLLVYPGTAPEPVPQARSVLAFDLAQPDQPRQDVAETGALFASGLNRVVRPDGALMAQKLDGGDGVVGIRIVPAAQPAVPGQLLAAPLRGGCSYNFVDMAFSPDGKRLAATADCPQRWGQESAALLVWDVETGNVVERIPTRHWWGEMAWLDERTLVLSRYDVEARRAGLFRVDLDG